MRVQIIHILIWILKSKIPSDQQIERKRMRKTPNIQREKMFNEKNNRNPMHYIFMQIS